MKRIQIQPLAKPVKATVTIPGSKSYTNRALVIGALTAGKVTLHHPLFSDDTRAMINCLRSLGIEIEYHQASIDVVGDVSRVEDKDYDLDADISGTTMRFLTALCAVLPGRQKLHGGKGLHQRPIGDLVKALRQLGADIKYLGKDGCPPLLIGPAKNLSNQLEISGTVSSQYISALLMIAPRLNGLTLKINGELSSKPFVGMTVEAMKNFGVNTKVDKQIYEVAADQVYRQTDYVIEGDLSSAAYFGAIAVLTSSTLTLRNVSGASKQADLEFFKILEKMGNQVSYQKDQIIVTGKTIKALTVNMNNCPDQAQTLAVLAAFAKGSTRIKSIASLRVKETERVQALQQELEKMGIRTAATPASLTIQGGQPQPATIATYGDHRMAMAFAVAGTKLPGMIIEDPDVVTKTFPDFWEKLAQIGVTTQTIEPNIVLIGMRGSGKTTIANLLAKRLNIEQLDLDTIMTQKLHMATPEIVAKHGWDYFRHQEATITQQVAGLNGKLISTGGGVVTKPQNIKALKQNSIVILLRASVDTLLSRLKNSGDRPPLTTASSLRAEVEQIHNERKQLYESAADIIIDTDTLQPKQVVERIISELKERQA